MLLSFKNPSLKVCYCHWQLNRNRHKCPREDHFLINYIALPSSHYNEIGPCYIFDIFEGPLENIVSFQLPWMEAPGWWEGNLPSIPFQIYFRRYLPRIKIWLPSITAKSSQENYLFEMRNHFWNASGQRRESGLMSIESDELCLRVENKGLVVAGRGGCYWQWMTIGHRQPREKHNSVFWSSQWYLSFKNGKNRQWKCDEYENREISNHLEMEVGLLWDTRADTQWILFMHLNFDLFLELNILRCLCVRKWKALGNSEIAAPGEGGIKSQYCSPYRKYWYA